MDAYGDSGMGITKDFMVECSECGYEFYVYFEGDNQTDLNSRIHQYLEELTINDRLNVSIDLCVRVRDRCRVRRRSTETSLARNDD